jgi:hypothetical protein
MNATPLDWMWIWFSTLYYTLNKEISEEKISEMVPESLFIVKNGHLINHEAHG